MNTHINHKNLLDITAQKKILNSTIKSAGDRYNDDLHIPTTELVNKLDVAAHGDTYKGSILAIYNDILALVDRPAVKRIAKKDISIILERVSRFVSGYPLATFDWCGCRTAIVRVQDACYEKLREIDNPNQQGDAIEKTFIRDLINQLNYLSDLISEGHQDLYNSRLAILCGEGGIGKTHLLCDYAKQRLASNLPTIILLSDTLTDSNPVLAITRKLGFKSKKLFLEELQNVADQYGQICIIIDAINENPAIKWRRLAEILTIRSVSIILSIRSGFEAATGVDGWKVPHIEHHGFTEATLEWQAMQKYFKHYGLQDIADTPILYMEFRNPLFLKIFCESYSGTKTGKKPRGNMMTNVFEQYVVNKTKAVSRDLGMKMEKKYIWDNIIKEIACVLGYKGIQPTISHKKLYQIIKNTWAVPVPVGRVIDSLCRNGILRRTPHYTRQHKRRGYDYEFVYHKFSDHVIVRYFLNSFGDNIFAITKSSLFKNALKQWNTGLIEALAIQYPERYNGHELIEIISPKYRFSRAVWPAVLGSITWRDPKKFSNDGVRTIEQYIKECNRKEGILLNYLDELISVAIVPEHPFNALKLHSILSKNPMPKRDAWWQEYTRYLGNGGDSFNRICSWVFSEFSIDASIDQKILAIIALSWFLVSTSKGIRDCASYAILKLAGTDMAIIYKVLNKFKNCDDQYILERLYLITYGVAIYSCDNETDFRKVVNFIDETIFKDENRVPNIIIEQCARDVVSLYYSRYGNINNPTMPHGTPPRGYRNPFKRLPSIKTIIDKYGAEGAKNDCHTIIGSVMYPDAGIADFGNYTMSRLNDLSNVPISESIPEDIQQYNNFLSSLTPTQDDLLWDYRSTLSRSVPSRMPQIKLNKTAEDKITVESCIRPATATEPEVMIAKRAFVKALSKLQQEQLAGISEYIFTDKNPNIRYRDRQYDLSWARRWVFKNVLRLGWSHNLHGDIDVALCRQERIRGSSDIARIERIGKKYQWISLHQLMALASSKYYLMDNYGSYMLRLYNNSLDFNDRTFDPTIPPDWVIDGDGRLAINDDTDTLGRDNQSVWWQPNYNIISEDKWLFSTYDIPKMSQLINIGQAGQEYLALLNCPTWQKHYSKTKWRQLWIQINSYIIKIEDIPKVAQLCQGNTFNPTEWELPSPGLYDDLFLGEVLRGTPVFSPIFNDAAKLLPPNKNRPFPVAPTTSEYDGGSFELGPIMKRRIQMPSPFLRKLLKLDVDDSMAFINTGDSQKIFCPSVNSSSNNNQFILVANKSIIDRLHASGYTIMWTAIGEKQEIDDMFPYKDSVCLRGYAYMDADKRLIEKMRFNKVSNEFKK